MQYLSKVEQELQDFEDIFWALAHASRRQILVVLHARGGRMSAGDIAQRFSCSWPTTTRHLKVLEKAKLVTLSKEGRENYYELSHMRLDRVRDWLNYLKEDAGETQG